MIRIVASIISFCMVMGLVCPVDVPVDVSFFAIDLKFNRGNIKILEFQDGPQAGLRAYDYVFGKGGVWKSFWDEIFQLGLPVWYVGPRPSKFVNGEFSHNDSVHVAFDYFLSKGGGYFPTLSALRTNKFFIQTLSKKSRSPESKIPAHAIVLHKIEDWGSPSLREFVAQCPRAVVINRYLRNFSMDKIKTHEMLCNAGLASLRPRTGIYRKNYYPKLASNIIKDLGGDLFVVKPVNSSRSNGVLVVQANRLNAVLKKIMTAQSTLRQHNMSMYRPDKTLGIEYWKNDPNKEFIVESFESSQDLWVNGKRYDPTMRVIFYMCSDGEKTTVKRLSAFWKVSGASLDDAASLTDIHVSKFRDDISSLDPKDLTVRHDDLNTLDSVMIPAVESMYSYVLKHPTW